MKKTILAALGILLAAQAWAADEVKLLRSQSTVSTKYGITVQSVRFEALVKNLAYAKQVYAHLKKPDGSWVDVPLAYHRAADTGREVWVGNFLDSTATGPTFQTWDLEFALRYKVNGQEYWDNNAGKNYKQAKDSGSLLVGTQVLARYADTNNPYYVYGGSVYGSVTVKNLAAAKSVKVLYSTDGWKTSQTAQASFSSTHWTGGYSAAANPNAYGSEEWTYELLVGNTATRVEYAVSYTVNGATYWDNNFGRNYVLSLARL